MDRLRTIRNASAESISLVRYDGAMSLGELIAAMIIVWRVFVPIQIVSLNMARRSLCGSDDCL
jgi:hypothetical protein